MAKQRKGPEQEAPQRVDRDSLLAGLAPELAEQSALGNAAVQASLDGSTAATRQVPLEVVRDVALPLVERGALALHVLPHDPVTLQRHIALLERSALPEKGRLIEQLRGDQASALAIADAVKAAFGEDSEALRSAWIDVLDAIVADLHGGVEDGTAWRVGDRRVDLGEVDPDASVATRAEDLLEMLVAAAAPPELGVADAGPAVRSFCLAVFLALHADEEEEEEDDFGSFGFEEG